MNLIVIININGDEKIIRVYDDWTIKDILKFGKYKDNNYTEKFIKFYESKMNDSISNIKNILFIDTNKFKSNQKLYSPEYYKSDPLNKYKLYGRLKK